MAPASLIVIVDDDLPSLEAMVSLVRAMGFHAKGFSAATEFLNSQLLKCAKCLILDVRMPAMSGIELFLRLRRTGLHIPTIFATAFPDEVSQASAMLAGVTCYLQKPYDPDMLLACIQEALGTA